MQELELRRDALSGRLDGAGGRLPREGSVVSNQWKR